MVEPIPFLQSDENDAPASVRLGSAEKTNSLRSRRRATPPIGESVWNFSFVPSTRRTSHRRLPPTLGKKPDAPLLLKCARKRPRTTIGVVVVVLCYAVLKKYKPYNGRRMDHFLIYWTLFPWVRQQERAWQQRLGGAVPILPRTEPTQFPAQLHTHLLLRTLLIHRHDRAVLLQQLAQNADRWCRDHKSLSSEDRTMRHRPVVVLVPQLFHDRNHRWDDVSAWVRPSQATAIVRWDAGEMEQLVHTVASLLHFPLLEQIYQRPQQDRAAPHQERVHIWALCVVYLYGGIFVNGNPSRQLPEPPAPYHTWYRDQLQHFLTRDNASPRVVLVQQSDAPPEIQFVGSLHPRHSLLHCFLYQYIDSLNTTKSEGWFSPAFHNGNVAQWQRWLGPRSDKRQSTCLPMEDVKEACNTIAAQSAMNDGYISTDDLTKPGQGDNGGGGSSLYIQWIKASSRRIESLSSMVDVRFVAEIRERGHESMTHAPRQPKVSLQSIMQRQRRNIEPNWFCNRCLHWSVFGTYQSCTAVCAKKYFELMCHKSHPLLPEKNRNVTIDVVVRRDASAAPSAALDLHRSSETRIPRIIHQTWYDDVTYDRYPQLARLQASWKTYAGWEYRFYNDDAARQYIQTHYPSRFLDAYDALIHGAYKADLFRYLVLLREGGVYADIDIMLQGSLDALITSSLSFFVPRDVPCAYAGEAYCLWNGLIGSSPGNPIIVRAVERLVNFIEDRADMYDMERATCLRSQSSSTDRFDVDYEVWKLRAEPLLVLSGPCGLGMAMNEALQRHPLTSIPLGGMRIDPVQSADLGDHGDALILLGDKYDLGEFRISHPETGCIIAATDILSDLDKSAVELDPAFAAQNSSLRQRKDTPQHYSKSKTDHVIWGAANVYKDNLVRSERILLHLNV
jgi:predicted secreted protein